MPQTAGYRSEGMFGSVETVGSAGVFGQVMGLVAVTLAFFAAGLLLGLGMGGVLDGYAEAEPDAVWQAASATALFVGGLGAARYAIRKDLSGGYRLMFFLLMGLIIFGLVTVFVSIPGGNIIYAVLGLGVFGAYTVLARERAGGPTAAL